MEFPLQAADHNFRLADVSPDPLDGIDRKNVEKEADEDLERLDDLCYLMYAENKHALLVVLQGIDTSGKNSTTKHIAKGVNPDGLTVQSFKKPSELEIEHDYLWRVHRVTPRRGNVTVFNRSHYEEVIVTRVMPDIIGNQHLPESIAEDPDIFEKRYRQINDFERMLSENGTTIVKFFLHISREEQLERFRERVENPRKQWKFSLDDLEARRHWPHYMHAYEEMIRNTSTPWAPWYAIPANHKWYRNWLVSRILVETLERLNMKFPMLENNAITLEELSRA